VLTLVARALKPGVSREQAEAGITPLWRSIRAGELSAIKNKTDVVAKHFVQESSLQLLDERRGFSPLRDQIQTPLLIVMAMGGLVVLMVCVNVSSLLLVRAAARVKEMSVRYAIGAGCSQIIRQLLMEGPLLGLLGSALGLSIAPVVLAFLTRRMVGDATRTSYAEAHPSITVVGRLLTLCSPLRLHRFSLALADASSAHTMIADFSDTVANRPTTRTTSARIFIGSSKR
jgi:hypothetical protein